MRARAPRCFRHQRGLTMVELMVALLLGLLLTAGAIQVFMANRATHEFNNGLSRLQENGRFALDAIAYNVRMAGFLGCLSEVPVFNNLGDNPATKVEFNFEQAIYGYEAVGTNEGQSFAPASTNPENSIEADDWAPALPAPILNNVVPGSDVLVVRGVSAQAFDLVSPFNDANKVIAAAAPGDLAKGDIAVVSDCQKASVFQITAINDTSGGGDPKIDVLHAAGTTPGNATTAWGTDQLYGAGSQLMRAETWIYFVGERPGGGPPALFQMRLDTDSDTTTSFAVAEELVEAVDTMQIMYGIDEGLNGSLDRYDEANGVGDWGEVVAVRVSLLVRSPDEYGTERDTRTYDVNGTTVNPVDDRRLRQVFTSTISLRNRLP